MPRVSNILYYTFKKMHIVCPQKAPDGYLSGDKQISVDIYSRSLSVLCYMLV